MIGASEKAWPAVTYECAPRRVKSNRPQVSLALGATVVDMLHNPTSANGWQADPDALAEVVEAVEESVQMPTPGATLVVTLCTDGSRAAQVRPC